uniref:uncharacterized protein LOC122591684 n=1 Tax=Erigeron canadensis TaxID=72917 RepID=UPI001CB9BF9D|nr:uncharacterized protein LOC122591684 [Erigeron canadensis]
MIDDGVDDDVVRKDNEWRNGEYQRLVSVVKELETRAESRPLSEEELRERLEAKRVLSDEDRLKSLDAKQKSRVRWAVDGDENTKYFHGVIKANTSNNRINGLEFDGVWLIEPVLLKEKIIDHFSNKFAEPISDRPKLCCPNLIRLTVAEADALVTRFSLSEIESAVGDCAGERAPEPDGFNFKVIKRFWGSLKNDFVKLFDKFHNEATISNSCMSSFVALIPKVSDLMKISDYRPISLVGCLNKVLSKVLANRLKEVIGKLISKEQTAYIASRSILDGPVILNETRSWIRWVFRVNGDGGFSARASVLVNGSPTAEYVGSRGLRQGDPLSPFLFLIVMEALSGMMKKAVASGLFQGIRVNLDGPLLSHFLFADDGIFLGDWSIQNGRNLKRILRVFYLMSGLRVNLSRVNLSKCSVYGIGVDDEDVESMARTLGCKAGFPPFIHLGLPVGANMNLERNWAPSKVIDALERLRRTFFWGGNSDNSKISWVAWDQVIAPECTGGIGFSSLQNTNFAMLSKWWWRFKVDIGGLWRKVVWAIRSSCRSWSFIPKRLSQVGPWKQIAKISEILRHKEVCIEKAIVGVVQSVGHILFWIDVWAGAESLATLFPYLYAKEKKKLCTVNERIIFNENTIIFSWEWRSSSLSMEEQDELVRLQGLLAHVTLSDRPDTWKWKLDKTGMFTVASLKEKLSMFGRESLIDRFHWNSWVPMKVNMVAWRANINRLPTKDNIVRRNIILSSDLCVFCGESTETVEHVLHSCPFTQAVWEQICLWNQISSFFAFGVCDLWKIHQFHPHPRTKNRKKALYAVILVTVWSVWKARNDVVFNRLQPRTSTVLEEIKALSLLWIRHRSRLYNLDCVRWRDNGVSCID